MRTSEDFHQHQDRRSNCHFLGNGASLVSEIPLCEHRSAVQPRAELAVEDDADEAIKCKNLTVFEPPSTDRGGSLRLPCGGKSYKEQRSARTSPVEADLEGCEDSISSHFRFDKSTINESVLRGHREHGSGRQPLIEENSEEDDNVVPTNLGLGEDVFHNEGSSLSQHHRSRLRGSWRVSEDKTTMAESEVATLELRLQTKEGEVVNLLAELRAREKEVHDLRTEVWRWRRMAEMPHAFSTGAGASHSEYTQKNLSSLCEQWWPRCRDQQCNKRDFKFLNCTEG